MIGIEAFHTHLDICQQCREHPFQLCSVGSPLLKEAATGDQSASLIILDEVADILPADREYAAARWTWRTWIAQLRHKDV